MRLLRWILGGMLLGTLLSLPLTPITAQDVPKPDSCQEQLKTLQGLQARISTQYDQLTADQIFPAFQPALQEPMLQLNHILSQVRIINMQLRMERNQAQQTHQQDQGNFAIVAEQARQNELDKKRLQEEVDGLRAGLTHAQAEATKLRQEVDALKASGKAAQAEKEKPSEFRP